MSAPHAGFIKIINVFLLIACPAADETVSLVMCEPDVSAGELFIYVSVSFISQRDGCDEVELRGAGIGSPVIVS